MEFSWGSLSKASKFSIIAFIVTIPLGLFSMGILGGLLYYTVAFLFSSMPHINDWHGDWVWPTFILAGMLWSLGFLLAGYAWHRCLRFTNSRWALVAVYLAVLWLSAALMWWIALSLFRP